MPVGIPARKLAANAYTYVGQDKVGPALYNPNSDATRAASRDNDFATSKTKRKIFEPVNERENKQPDAALPGPGKYEPLNINT